MCVVSTDSIDDMQVNYIAQMCSCAVSVSKHSAAPGVQQRYRGYASMSTREERRRRTRRAAATERQSPEEA